MPSLEIHLRKIGEASDGCNFLSILLLIIIFHLLSRGVATSNKNSL